MGARPHHAARAACALLGALRHGGLDRGLRDAGDRQAGVDPLPGFTRDVQAAQNVVSTRAQQQAQQYYGATGVTLP